jgi:2-oxoglutarate ferredoxin oxidoreductase subunit alpha
MAYEFIDGAEALARAALLAGCNFYAGYPISPATKIHLLMMDALPSSGGVAIQGEDEIASISMCIGAAMTGRKAMTATSGPGISLYSESIGLAVMGEVPLVIVDVQRMGPATGGATTGAEGDVQFVRWPTSGGLPMVVLAPARLASILPLTVHAFNLSEMLRTPVILLTSKQMVLSKQTVDMDRVKPPEIRNREYFTSRGEYVPYQFDKPAHIPPFLPMGAPRPVRFTGSMHDERGYLTKDPAKAKRKLGHLEQKIISNAQRIESVTMDLQKGSSTLVVAYGLNVALCEEAVRIVRREGKRCSLVTVESLFPVPEKTLQSALQGIRTVVVPELNVGLYAESLKPLLAPGQRLIPVTRFDGEPLSVDAVIREGGLL